MILSPPGSPPPAPPLLCTEPWRWISREQSIPHNPQLSAELLCFSGVNSVDFMQRVTEQTKLIQQGLKTLRGEVDNPLRVLDLGQEAIVLSGLNRSASDSLKNIKNLYDETKYLKSYLEKVGSLKKLTELTVSS